MQYLIYIYFFASSLPIAPNCVFCNHCKLCYFVGGVCIIRLCCLQIPISASKSWKEWFGFVGFGSVFFYLTCTSRRKHLTELESPCNKPMLFSSLGWCGVFPLQPAHLGFLSPTLLLPELGVQICFHGFVHSHLTHVVYWVHLCPSTFSRRWRWNVRLRYC